MNDDNREKLSAYLDGALSDEQRRAVEVEISRSEEMSRELAALRSVSEAVKGLGKEKLPEGFLTRLQARRARETAAPRASYRPLALALSTAVIVLVVWDRTHHPRELLKPLPDWDGGGVALQSAAPASGGAIGSLPPTAEKDQALSGGGDSAADLNRPSEPSAKIETEPSIKKENVFIDKLEMQNKPMRLAESKLSAPAAGSVPLFRAASEEGRLDGRRRSLSAARGNAVSGGAVRGIAAKALAPAKVAAPAAPAAAPVAKAVVLKNAAALQTAWTAAGLPGKPPFVDFSSQMAVFLAGPPGSGIVSVQDHNTSIVVLYKSSGFVDAFARVRAVTPSTKSIVAKLAD